MSTKPELEAEVEQLKAQLAALQTTPPAEGQPVPGADVQKLAEMGNELEQLKADIQKTADERDVALVEVSRLEAEVADYSEKMDDISTHLQNKLDEVDQVSRELSVSRNEKCTGENHVSLDGTKYDIIWRSTVRDVVYEGYHKRNIDENYTAIVVAKHGG